MRKNGEAQHSMQKADDLYLGRLKRRKRGCGPGKKPRGKIIPEKSQKSEGNCENSHS